MDVFVSSYSPKIKGIVVAWLATTLLLSGCTKSGPGKPESALAPCTLHLTVAGKALHSDGAGRERKLLDELVQGIEKQTGILVRLSSHRNRTTDPEAILAAAAAGAGLCLNLQHATGEPNGFVTLTLRDVVKGTLLGETAITRDHPDRVVPEITDWLKGALPSKSRCPAFSLFPFLDRLLAEKNCGDMLTFLRDVEYATSADARRGDAFYQQCYQQTLAAESGRRIGTSQIMRLRLEGVPEGLRGAFGSAAESPELNRSVNRLTEQFSDLSVTCTDNCRAGSVQLTVQFNQAWYDSQNPSREDPVAPYLPLAGALVNYREAVAGLSGLSSIHRFKLFVRLMDVSGQELPMEVTGTSARPTLRSVSDPIPFFYPM